jgi:VanZ family protein
MTKDPGKAVRVHPWIAGRFVGRFARSIVRILCLCVLCIILVAGLWPFRAPRNEVRWLEAGNGLRFGRYGSAVSSGAFPESRDAANSLEIWLQPGVVRGAHTILAFEGAGSLVTPFAIQQQGSALSVRRHNVDNVGADRTSVFAVKNAFQADRAVFVTVTLGPHETSVYLDGVLAMTDPIAGDSSNNFTGRLVLADSSTASDGWPGQILGLATYGRQLTQRQVAEDYASWTGKQRPLIAEDEVPVALYLFDEKIGAVAHNQFDSATDLTIPARFFVLHPAAFLVPWREYRPTLEYWMDFGVNLAGFIPFGFCFAAYFSSIRGVRRPSATVVVLGFLTSLTIETLQIFLPTRCSGTTDLMTNTLGTAIGVAWYCSPWVQGLLAGRPAQTPTAGPEDGGLEPELVTSDSMTSS